MKDTDYIIMVIWSEDDNAYLSKVIDLPGCMADGRTREEAVSNAQIAIEDWIDTAKALGRSIPKPRNIDYLDEHLEKVKSDQRKKFEHAVRKQTEGILKSLIPQLTEEIFKAVSAQFDQTRSDLYAPSKIIVASQRAYSRGLAKT